MNKIINFRPFNIFNLRADCWEFGYHNHNFYELILVLNGNGSHIINQISHQYQRGDIFLLTPDDGHRFDIVEKSEFIFIKYTEQFLLDLLSTEKYNSWKDAIRRTLLRNPYRCKKVIQKTEDQDLFFSIANKILTEFQTYHLYSEELISHLFLSLMTILVRDSADTDFDETPLIRDELVNKILSYITQHALDNDKVKVDNLAKEFFISKYYVGSYIKRKTGFSLSYLIKQHKIKTAEKLLAQPTFNINEIAFRLGFTDTSHFCNFFKKYHHISPSKYRKANISTLDF